MVERSGTRFHIVVNPGITSQQCNRIVNLILLHGKKIDGAILNKFIGSNEQSYGKISALSKNELKQIISSVKEQTSFIVVSPEGAGFGVLGSDFWTHPQLSSLLSR